MKPMPPNQLMVRLYSRGLGLIVGRMILLLKTTGRKSGLERVTPLQYELIDGRYYLGAANGLKADWVRNIQAKSNVKVQVGRREFSADAEVVTEVERIADFLEIRLKRHPLMVGAILKSDGLPGRPDRASLVEYSRKLVLVILTPA